VKIGVLNDQSGVYADDQGIGSVIGAQLQFVPSRRRRMMANVRAERLLKIPAEPSPELLIPGAAAQTRVVCMAGIRLGSGESARAFKGIICDDISGFESHMPRQAVGLSASSLCWWSE
jgi:hypothetical protein